jgi:hypothetical protein
VQATKDWCFVIRSCNWKTADGNLKPLQVQQLKNRAVDHLSLRTHSMSALCNACSWNTHLCQAYPVYLVHWPRVTDLLIADAKPCLQMQGACTHVTRASLFCCSSFTAFVQKDPGLKRVGEPGCSDSGLKRRAEGEEPRIFWRTCL